MSGKLASPTPEAGEDEMPEGSAQPGPNYGSQDTLPMLPCSVSSDESSAPVLLNVACVDGKLVTSAVAVDEAPSAAASSLPSPNCSRPATAAEWPAPRGAWATTSLRATGPLVLSAVVHSGTTTVALPSTTKVVGRGNSGFLPNLAEAPAERTPSDASTDELLEAAIARLHHQQSRQRHPNQEQASIGGTGRVSPPHSAATKTPAAPTTPTTSTTTTTIAASLGLLGPGFLAEISLMRDGGWASTPTAAMSPAASSLSLFGPGFLAPFTDSLGTRRTLTRRVPSVVLESPGRRLLASREPTTTHSSQSSPAGSSIRSPARLGSPPFKSRPAGLPLGLYGHAELSSCSATPVHIANHGGEHRDLLPAGLPGSPSLALVPSPPSGHIPATSPAAAPSADPDAAAAPAGGSVALSPTSQRQSYYTATISFTHPAARQRTLPGTSIAGPAAAAAAVATGGKPSSRTLALGSRQRDPGGSPGRSPGSHEAHLTAGPLGRLSTVVPTLTVERSPQSKPGLTHLLHTQHMHTQHVRLTAAAAVAAAAVAAAAAAGGGYEGSVGARHPQHHYQHQLLHHQHQLLPHAQHSEQQQQHVPTSPSRALSVLPSMPRFTPLPQYHPPAAEAPWPPLARGAGRGAAARSSEGLVDSRPSTTPSSPKRSPPRSPPRSPARHTQSGGASAPALPAQASFFGLEGGGGELATAIASPLLPTPLQQSGQQQRYCPSHLHRQQQQQPQHGQSTGEQPNSGSSPEQVQHSRDHREHYYQVGPEFSANSTPAASEQLVSEASVAGGQAAVQRPQHSPVQSRKLVPYSAAETPIHSPSVLPAWPGRSAANATGGGGDNLASGASPGRGGARDALQGEQSRFGGNAPGVGPVGTAKENAHAVLQIHGHQPPTPPQSQPSSGVFGPFSLRRAVYNDWVEGTPLVDRLGGACVGGVVASGLEGKAVVLKRNVQERGSAMYFKPAYQKPLLGGEVLHVL